MSRWNDNPREYAAEIARAYREDDTINHAETMAEDMHADPMLMVRAIADLDAEVNELTTWKAEAMRKMQTLEDVVMGLVEEVHGRQRSTKRPT